MNATLQRILCVEDQPDIRLLARVALTRVGGFQLLICSSGLEAIAQAPGFAPDLLLLDVMMPGMDGPTTLKNLRLLRGTASTPAIFLTARTDPADVANYLAAGAIGVIAKPFDPMTLSATVRSIWDQDQQQKQRLRD